MTLQQFQQLIKELNFTELFISELGWNKYPSQPLPPFQIGDIVFEIDGIAERNGLQILISYIDKLPTQTECKALDGKLRRLADSYILIFVENNTNHHLWSVPIKNNEKRQLVFVEYLTSQRLEFLYSKIGELTFDIDEKTYITDVKARVQKAFEVNSEKLTKDFYSGFQKQHKAFCQFITGINDDIPDKENRDKQWYTSVMLNRLMFCYFIQKKGFLNNDKNYLQNKLDWCQLRKGTDQFYSFYKSFLLQLFFGGLNAPKHDTSFEQEFGRIPYLNGGMFDKHQLERDYENIEICDEAFQQLFNFFDKWEWHLDTRVTASGRDINPDVLGYIFEQYINDRAQMGAYYTKEDITEYIGKNCILPFLMDKLKEQDPDAFKPNGYVWQSLQQSGDKYIYEAVKKGANAWDEIPAEIAQGIDTTQPNLLERRAHWNNTTPEQWALPTEIWRESIERMQRCRDIQSKISNGEITEINDFITYNLDIRTFVQDLLEKTNDHLLVLHFHKALTQVSILDPTCGSGAFLFAAMNILEPLYEICINRMMEFNATNAAWFKDILADLHTKYRSNIQYYIYKTIILNNLYGVDIMHEAVEIAKLRLFLKMVAVVDVDMRADNLGIDPLPDIDFNIRCGNTLVGYATEEQLKRDLEFAKDICEIESNFEFAGEIKMQMETVADVFHRFRQLQLTQNVEDLLEFKEAKNGLQQRLDNLNNLLNHKMYRSFTDGNIEYDEWLKSNQPFHWLAEYYHVIKGNSGFDVVIGNPPYVECKRSYFENINAPLVVCESGNLYSAVLHRCTQILAKSSTFGMIIPISYISTKQHKGVRCAIENGKRALYSSYDIRPAHLFEGAAQRLTIALYLPSTASNVYAEKQLRWHAETRSYLFENIVYREAFSLGDSIFRYGNEMSKSIVSKYMKNIKTPSLTDPKSFHVATTANNFIKALNVAPRYLSNDVPTTPSGWRCMTIGKASFQQYICIINSSIFYWLWKNVSDGFNLTTKFISMYANLENKASSKRDFDRLFNILMKDFQRNSEPHIRMQKTTGKTEIQLFRVKPLKPIIDKIDYTIGLSIGLTEEEVDFIINYDIKYRIGNELNGGPSEE